MPFGGPSPPPSEVPDTRRRPPPIFSPRVCRCVKCRRSRLPRNCLARRRSSQEPRPPFAVPVHRRQRAARRKASQTTMSSRSVGSTAANSSATARCRMSGVACSGQFREVRQPLAHRLRVRFLFESREQFFPDTWCRCWRKREFLRCRQNCWCRSEAWIGSGRRIRLESELGTDDSPSLRRHRRLRRNP